MQSVSSRIWTRVAVFISYDDNHYTTGTSNADSNWVYGLVRVELEVIVMEGFFTLSRSPEIKPQHCMQFSVKPSSPHFLEVSNLCKGYSQHILNPADGRFTQIVFILSWYEYIPSVVEYGLVGVSWQLKLPDKKQKSF